MYNFKNILINNRLLFEFLDKHDKKTDIFIKYINKDNIFINRLNDIIKKDDTNPLIYFSFMNITKNKYSLYLADPSCKLQYILLTYNYQCSRHIKQIIKDINIIIKTTNNIHIFYENFNILNYLVNLIENKNNMVNMKIYIFYNTIKKFFINYNINKLFNFENNYILCNQILGWFYIHDYIISDEIIIYNKRQLINIMSCIKNFYYYTKFVNSSRIGQSNRIIKNNIRLIKPYIYISIIKFYWISACIRYIIFNK